MQIRKSILISFLICFLSSSQFDFSVFSLPSGGRSSGGESRWTWAGLASGCCSGLLGFRREMRGCLGCVEAKKPLLEGGDEGNDRGKKDKSVLGWWVCGGRSRFVLEREAAPLGETGENGRERVVLWLAFKGRGQLLLGRGGKAGEQSKERLWLVAKGEETKGYSCERNGLDEGCWRLWEKKKVGARAAAPFLFYF